MRQMLVFIVAAAVTVGAAAAQDALDLDTSLSMAHSASAAYGAGGADEAAPVVNDSFLKGTWTCQVYGSATVGSNDGQLYLAHVGVGYHILDNVSLNLEGVFGHLNAAEAGTDDGFTYGFDLLVRWHFVNRGDWTVYLDGGAGMIWFEDRFPFGGSHQNFTPQFGVGFTWRLKEHLRVMAGVRWHHVSNANRNGDDENPGFDAAMIYAGVLFPF